MPNQNYTIKKLLVVLTIKYVLSIYSELSKNKQVVCVVGTKNDLNNKKEVNYIDAIKYAHNIIYPLLYHIKQESTKEK